MNLTASCKAKASDLGFDEIFARQLRAAGNQVAALNLMSLSATEFLWELATQLHRNPGTADPPFQLWRSIVDRLAENRYQQLPTVILLDDADEVGADVFGHITRLLHQDFARQSSLTVVLASDPTRLERLGRRILELSELRIELEPWDSEDTLKYLQSALRIAGSNQDVFDAQAASRLHELTQGVPRQVSYLAELALLAGAGRELPQIDAATVDSVHEELIASQ